MGFFKKVFSNPVSGYLVGGVPGSLLGAKNKSNSQIDSQMVNPGSPAPYLDPNDMGQPQQGGSPYLRMRQQMNTMDANRAFEQGQAGAMGDAAQARSQLAAHGGLDSGAAERIARAGMGNAANARQLTAQDLMRNNLAAGIEDEQARRNIYQQIRQGNQQMQNQLYAGNQMANATLNANRPKGLLGLGFLGL